MPRDYEAVYVFDSTLEDTAIQERLTRFHTLLGVAENATVDHWGRRQLAYPIGRRENGYYAVARFAADATALPEYERALRLDDGVLRYLLSLHEHELGAPPLSEDEMAARRNRQGDDEEDDE